MGNVIVASENELLVREERARAAMKHGGTDNDDKNGPLDWNRHIRRQLMKIEQLNVAPTHHIEPPPDGAPAGAWAAAVRAAYKERFMKIAGLALSAMDTIDRVEATIEEAAQGGRAM